MSHFRTTPTPTSADNDDGGPHEPTCVGGDRVSLTSVTMIEQTRFPIARRASAAKTTLIVLAAVVVIGGPTAYVLKGAGVVTKIRDAFGLRARPAPPPAKKLVPLVNFQWLVDHDRATGVDATAPIVLKLDLPNGGVDPSTINDDAVGVFRVDNRQRVAAKVTIDGKTLTITPAAPLEPNRNYRVHLLPVLRDVAGDPIKEATFSFFTTSKPPAGVAFEKVEIPAAQGEYFTCTFVSADHRLYASSVVGKLFRFDIAADGTLGKPEVFTTILTAEHGPRTVTGFAIDPNSSPADPIIYVTHSAFTPGYEHTPDLSGKLSRLSGPNFSKIEDLLTGLPRSARDHAPNQPHFGPDGALYFPQPSNSATGGADKYWEMRPEHLLNATILRFDTNAFPPGTPPLSVLTKDVGGTFDPFAANSPLTIYCTGVRMPFDLLWHSNGNLYSSINGASSSGATPAGPGIPGIKYIGLAEHDWFFKIDKGNYYGHPNPVLGHYVLNGGNPTAKPDFDEVSEYPVGTQPDSQWTSAIYDYGEHVSADGMVEYRGDRFGGALKGKILVCRFNMGGDLLCLGLDPTGKEVNYAAAGIPGFGDLIGPLDVSEDETTGNLYVCEFYGQKITLLRPLEGAAADAATHAASTRPVAPTTMRADYEKVDQ